MGLVLLLKGPQQALSPYFHRVRIQEVGRPSNSTQVLGVQCPELRIQFISASQSCPTLCNPMDCSTLGFPVYHQLLEFTQIHIHWVCDAIQPSHPLSSPSPPAFNLSQHQNLLQWVCFTHQVAKVLEFQLRHQPFQWIFRTDFLNDWLLRSPCCPRDSQESSPTPQFKSLNSSALSFLYMKIKFRLFISHSVCGTFFFFLVCFLFAYWSITDLQYYISFRCTTQWFDFYFILFCLAMLRGLQDVSSQPEMEPGRSALRPWSPNHWTTREFPKYFYIIQDDHHHSTLL